MVTYEYDQNGDKVTRDGEGNPNRLKDSMLNYMANIWFGMWSEPFNQEEGFLTVTNIFDVLVWINTWPGRWSCGTK